MLSSGHGTGFNFIFMRLSFLLGFPIRAAGRDRVAPAGASVFGDDATREPASAAAAKRLSNAAIATPVTRSAPPSRSPSSAGFGCRHGSCPCWLRKEARCDRRRRPDCWFIPCQSTKVDSHSLRSNTRIGSSGPTRPSAHSLLRFCRPERANMIVDRDRGIKFRLGFAELRSQPGSCVAPGAVGGRAGQAHYVGGVVHRQAREETQLHELSGFGVFFR